LNDTETFMRVLLFGVAGMIPILILFVFGFQFWLSRQSAEAQARWLERTTRYSERMLNVLTGTASVYAVVVVFSVITMLIAGVVAIGLVLTR